MTILQLKAGTLDPDVAMDRKLAAKFVISGFVEAEQKRS